MGKFLYSPEYWRQRANGMRDLAEQMDDVQAKAMMLRIADDEEAISRRLEGLTANSDCASLQSVVEDLKKEKEGDPL